jgi:hypothetical protein
MTTSIRRLVLLLLALSAAYVGGWALFAPHSFYRSFPGFGLHWVAVDGPYNEHLVRDVGGLYLALLVVSVYPLRPAASAQLRRVAGLAWFVFSAPHLGYHLAHLDALSTGSATLEAVALSATLVGAGLLLLPERG